MATETEQQLLKLSAQKWRWMSDQDVDALASVFDERAVFVHMGATFERDEELEVIRSGRIHYRDFDISEASARVIGSTGIVLTTMQLGSRVGGTEVSNPFVTTEVYVQAGEDWRLASLSFTRLVTH